MNKGILLSLILGIFLFSILTMIPTIFGALATTSPISYGNYSSTMTVTCTKLAIDSPNNITRVYLIYNATGGASKDTTILESASASGGVNTSVTFIASTTTLTEARIYNMTCLFGNGTTNSTAPSKTNITIDRTNPVVSVSTDQSKAYQTKYIGLNWSCTDATAGVSTNTVTLTANADAGCTLDGTTSWTTATGSQALSTTQTQCAGLYTNSLSCTDFSGNSNTASSTFNIYYPEGGSVVIPNLNQVTTPAGTTSISKRVFWILGITFGLVIIIILSFLAISQSKKRR